MGTESEVPFVIFTLHPPLTWFASQKSQDALKSTKNKSTCFCISLALNKKPKGSLCILGSLCVQPKRLRAYVQASWKRVSVHEILENRENIRKGQLLIGRMGAGWGRVVFFTRKDHVACQLSSVRCNVTSPRLPVAPNVLSSIRTRNRFPTDNNLTPLWLVLFAKWTNFPNIRSRSRHLRRKYNWNF